MRAFSRVVDDRSSVIQQAIRSEDTGVSLAGLFEPGACCWPALVPELLDACPLAPADGGPLPPPLPFDVMMGLGEGVDDVDDGMFMMKTIQNRSDDYCFLRRSLDL
jgi:hypothetical protein